MKQTSTIFLFLLMPFIASRGQNTFFVSFELINEFSTVKQYVEQKKDWAVSSIEENQSITVNAPEGDCSYLFNRGKLYQVEMQKLYNKKNGKRALEGTWEYLRVTGAQEISTFEEDGWKIQTYARANRIIELSLRQKGGITELGLMVQYIPFAPMEDKSEFAHKAREMETLRQDEQKSHQEFVIAYRDSLMAVQALVEAARIEDSIRMAKQAIDMFVEEDPQENDESPTEFQATNKPAPSSRPAAPARQFNDELPPMEDMSHQLFAAPAEDTTSIKVPITEAEPQAEEPAFGEEKIPDSAGFGEEVPLKMEKAVTDTPEVESPVDEIED
ncbi:MAG: hypothetical protein AAGI38_15875 [Bacteroidota bacterium]